MSRLSGKAGEVLVAAVSVAGIKSWSLEYTVEAVDSTGFDSAGVSAFIPGISKWSGSFEGHKDDAPLTIGTEVALVLKESQTAAQKANGQAIITSFGDKTEITGLVAYSYSFQGTGALTIPSA